MDNNVNVEATVAPAKKSSVGLIIGLVIALLVVVGGFLAAFFLWIKPTFIDGASSGSEEKEEEKTSADLYATYLKKNYEEDEIEISFIDFDNDDNPELIVKDGDKILEIATLNEKNKVVGIKVNKYAEIDLVYDINEEKQKWVIVDDDYAYYDIGKSLKNEELASPDRFVTEEKAEARYTSLETEIEYEEVEANKASKSAKSLIKKTNYETEKTVSEVKKEIEELKKSHILTCKGKVDEDDENSGDMTFEFEFKNNLLTNVRFYMVLDAGVELTEEQEKQALDTMKQSFGSNGNLSISKVSGTTYKISGSFTIKEFMKFAGMESYDESDLKYSEVEDLIDELESDGATCSLS